MKPTILVITTLFGFGYSISMGPCPTNPIQTVDVDLSKWNSDHDMYVFLVTKGNDLKCMRTERFLKDGKMAETFHRYEKGVRISNPVPPVTRVGKGHYTFNAVIGGRTITFHAYFMIFDAPRLDCHIVCSNDQMFANYQGTAVYCEHQMPDAPKEFAREIKQALVASGLDISTLEIADNCNCNNIPYPFGPCTKTVMTAREFFAGA